MLPEQMVYNTSEHNHDKTNDSKHIVFGKRKTNGACNIFQNMCCLNRSVSNTSKRNVAKQNHTSNGFPDIVPKPLILATVVYK